MASGDQKQLLPLSYIRVGPSFSEHIVFSLKNWTFNPLVRFYLLSPGRVSLCSVFQDDEAAAA